MELRHFRYFVAVAEELHFGRAAERLGIAQPALSIQIRQLETALGGQLFHRANRGVTLTETGRLFLKEARETLDRAAQAEQVARRAAQGELATIIIGYSANAALSGILAKAISAIGEANPGFKISVQELDPISILESLLQRRINFGLTTTLGLDIPRELKATILAQWPLLVALPKNHPLTQLEEVPLARLSSEPFIVYAESPTHDGLTILRHIAGFTPAVGQRATSGIMVAALVGAGLGVALLPSLMQLNAPIEGVSFRRPDMSSVSMDCSLISWKSEYEPAVKKAVAAVIQLPTLTS